MLSISYDCTDPCKIKMSNKDIEVSSKPCDNPISVIQFITSDIFGAERSEIADALFVFDPQLLPLCKKSA